jgi:hypothetical protein
MQPQTIVYKVTSGGLEPIERTGNGSINSIIDHLGYERSQLHVVLATPSQNIECIACKIFTREPVFVIVKNGISNPTLSLLQTEIQLIDWDFEYSSNNIESMLDDGIDELTYDFLSSVIELKSEGSDFYLAPQLQLYLSFKDQKLSGYASSEWENASAKWLKNLNPKLFKVMLDEAKEFHDSEREAMEEVNLQCDALQSIPHAVKNEFVPLHQKTNGTVNFYNLLTAHYKNETTKSEFLIVNKGRYIQRNQNEYEVGQFIYCFTDNGKLIKIIKTS